MKKFLFLCFVTLFVATATVNANVWPFSKKSESSVVMGLEKEGKNRKKWQKKSGKKPGGSADYYASCNYGKTKKKKGK